MKLQTIQKSELGRKRERETMVWKQGDKHEAWQPDIVNGSLGQGRTTQDGESVEHADTNSLRRPSQDAGGSGNVSIHIKSSTMHERNNEKSGAIPIIKKSAPARDKNGRFAHWEANTCGIAPVTEPVFDAFEPSQSEGQKPITWQELKFPEPKDWKPLVRTKRMNVAAAEKEIEAGVTIISKDGRELHIGKTLLEHFSEKEQSIRKARLEDWPVMKEILRSPHEIWENERTGQRLYIGRFVRLDAKEDKREKRFGELVAFTYRGTNELQTYFPPSRTAKLRKMRKGIPIYHNHKQE